MCLKGSHSSYAHDYYLKVDNHRNSFLKQFTSHEVTSVLFVPCHSQKCPRLELYHMVSLLTQEPLHNVYCLIGWQLKVRGYVISYFLLVSDFHD